MGVLSRLGCPLEIFTDQGKNFDGKVFNSLCEILHITKKRTTPYRPSSNGQVERYNRTILQIIRCFLKESQGDWDKYLQQIAGSIRSIVNRQTGFTANFMMLHREVSQPLDLMLGVSEINRISESPSEYLLRLEEVQREINRIARENLQSAQVRQKRDYDLHLYTETYEVGDLVYLINSATKVGQSSKLSPTWKGPYLVVKVYSPVLFKIANQKRQTVVHHDRLKPCRDREIPFWLRRMRAKVLNGESIGMEQDLGNLDLENLFSEGNKLVNDNQVIDNPITNPNQVITNPSQVISESVVDSPESIEVSDPPPMHVTNRGRISRRPRYLDEFVTD